MSHTPGPWDGDFNAGPQVLGGVPLRLVANVERLGDIWLIAAAPDLLKALKSLLNGGHNSITKERAEAAIAKAEDGYEWSRRNIEVPDEEADEIAKAEVSE